VNQRDWHNLVSGQRTGFSAVFLRLVLGIAACGYSLVIRVRNFLYSTGIFRAHPTSAAVISIGNITAGGTGKTPLVVWLVNQLSGKYQCAILTRGYKTRIGPLLDEPAILAQSCPEARVIVNPDRVAGAAEAVRFGANVLIMDDGFQHRRLARDVDILAIDATMPFGYGKILPAGLLREPVSAIKRADAVVITRSDQADEDQMAQLEQEIRRIKGDMIIAKSTHAPLCAESTGAEQISPEELKGKKIFAFCGIGNPDSFLTTIADLGANLVGSEIFDDHHRYSEGCLAGICEQAIDLDAVLALTTQKDWTKIAPLLSGEETLPLAYLAVEIGFTAGEDELKRLIQGALAGRITRK